MPDWREEIARRLSSLRLDSTRENDIIDELSQHLEDRYLELVSGGAPDDEARRDVRMELNYENLLVQGVIRGDARSAANTRGAWKQWAQLPREPLARPALRTPPVPAQP
jgi:hypothetical protein